MIKMCSYLALLATTLLVTVCSTYGHPGHDSCRGYGHDHYTWTAAQGEELDAAAMMAMPTSYVTYGWRHYQSGRCSYKGHPAPCPDSDDYHERRHEYYSERPDDHYRQDDDHSRRHDDHDHNSHHHHREEYYHGSEQHDELFFDRLFIYPRLDGSICQTAGDCCSRNCVEGVCCASNKKANNATCSVPGDCCSNICVNGTCAAQAPPPCIPNTGPGSGSCSADGDCCGTNKCYPNTDTGAVAEPFCCDLALDQEQCNQGGDCCGGYCNYIDPTLSQCGGQACFSGNTRVRILESAEPVTMRELQTGQHVLCLDSNEDLRLPTTASWCEVKNWIHAQTITFTQIRISFSRPGGRGQDSITLSPTHLFMKLTGASEGATAASVDAFGSFDLKPASGVAPGDLFPVLVDPAKPEDGFVVVAVADTQAVQDEGMYMPWIEKAFLVAEDAVMPLNVDSRTRVWGPAGLDGYKQAHLQYLRACLFMARFQPNGTSGLNGDWNGDPKWPGLYTIRNALAPHRAAGQTLNFTVLQEWFLPLYEDWKEDETKAITLEQTIAFLETEALWINPERGQRNTEKDISSLINSL